MGCVCSGIAGRFGWHLTTPRESDSPHCDELQSVEAQKQVDIATQSFFNAVIDELFVVATRRWGATVVIEHFSDCILERPLQLHRQPHKAGQDHPRHVISYKRGLLTDVFNPKREGHDGAVILQLFDGSDFVPKIAAKGVVLPTLTNVKVPRELTGRGSRHRSAYQLSHLTNATIIVVSEERGSISFFQNGKAYCDINKESMKVHLRTFPSLPSVGSGIIDAQTFRYNFAICGQTKVGKSSLINALRGYSRHNTSATSVLPEDDRGTSNALVGQIGAYHRGNADDHTMHNHLSVDMFEISDVDCISLFSSTFSGILCVVRDDFTENDTKIAHVAKQRGIPVGFVRSKSDVDLINAYLDGTISVVSQEAADIVTKKLRKYLRGVLREVASNCVKVPLFCVSCDSLYALATNTIVQSNIFFEEKKLLAFMQNCVYAMSSTAQQ